MANLTALDAKAPAPTLILATPTVTTTSTVSSWTVHLGPVKAVICHEYDTDFTWSTVSVSSKLAESVDPLLAELARQERDLSDIRYAKRNLHAQVDDLYDRLNAQIALVSTGIATAVLPLLGVVLDNHARLLDKLEFDAYAGCTSCKCTPGVKAPYARRHGGFLQISIESAGA